MNNVEDRLKSLILTRYKSVREFTNSIDMPYSTFDSILKRGVANSNIANILKISRALGIDAEKLAYGEIVSKENSSYVSNLSFPQTIAAHFDGDEYTQDELEEINKFAEFVRQRRKK